MNKRADLHTHTWYSDGTSSPGDIVREALKKKLSAIAITDHDTIEGVVPTQEAARAYDLKVIAGVELSAEDNGKDIHILGYFQSPLDTRLQKEFLTMQAARRERIKKMITKLDELGLGGIDAEDVFAMTKSSSVGRPHLARMLVDKKYVKSIREAFDRYLADDRPAFVPKFRQTPFEAIALIQKYNGIAVLAHPMFTSVDEMIPALVDAGLKGLEVHYPNCAANVIEHYARLAEKYDLIATGGSDFHGEAKDNTFLGKVSVPYSVVEQLHEIWGK